MNPLIKQSRGRYCYRCSNTGWRPQGFADWDICPHCEAGMRVRRSRRRLVWLVPLIAAVCILVFVVGSVGPRLLRWIG